MHTPVLLQQTIEHLNIQPKGKYIDATVGEGGHLQAIIDKGGTALGIDWDMKQIERLKSEIQSKQAVLTVGNYVDIETVAKENGFNQVDGILFDFGLSMDQLAHSGKGFSFKNVDEPLDMRIGEGPENTASDLVNVLNKDELFNIFARYSEEIHSREIANEIVIRRIRNKIQRVGDLLNIIDHAIKKCEQRHDHNLIKIYTRIFQALRIAVNEEFENIKKGLAGALSILKPDGRIVIITFHSLEDRIVKNFVRTNNLKFLDKKLIVGDRTKSFERSAKLRVITKT